MDIVRQLTNTRTYRMIILIFLFFAMLFMFISLATLTTADGSAVKVIELAPIAEETTAIAKTAAVIEETKATKNERLTPLGVFKLTAYDACTVCCGKSDGITATGTKAKAGRTVAVDPTVIPYGTKLIINDNTYIAEDCGGAIKGKIIDVFFDTHAEALAFGVQYAEVYAADISL